MNTEQCMDKKKIVDTANMDTSKKIGLFRVARECLPRKSICFLYLQFFFFKFWGPVVAKLMF